MGVLNTPRHCQGRIHIQNNAVIVVWISLGLSIRCLGDPVYEYVGCVNRTELGLDSGQVDGAVDVDIFRQEELRLANYNRVLKNFRNRIKIIVAENKMCVETCRTPFAGTMPTDNRTRKVFCWCFHKPFNYTEVDETNCFYRCERNCNDRCGGPNSLSLYADRDALNMTDGDVSRPWPSWSKPGKPKKGAASILKMARKRKEQVAQEHRREKALKEESQVKVSGSLFPVYGSSDTEGGGTETSRHGLIIAVVVMLVLFAVGASVVIYLRNRKLPVKVDQPKKEKSKKKKKKKKDKDAWMDEVDDIDEMNDNASASLYSSVNNSSMYTGNFSLHTASVNNSSTYTASASYSNLNSASANNSGQYTPNVHSSVSCKTGTNRSRRGVEKGRRHEGRRRKHESRRPSCSERTQSPTMTAPSLSQTTDPSPCTRTQSPDTPSSVNRGSTQGQSPLWGNTCTSTDPPSQPSHKAPRSNSRWSFKEAQRVTSFRTIVVSKPLPKASRKSQSLYNPCSKSSLPDASSQFQNPQSVNDGSSPALNTSQNNSLLHSRDRNPPPKDRRLQGSPQQHHASHKSLPRKHTGDQAWNGNPRRSLRAVQGSNRNMHNNNNRAEQDGGDCASQKHTSGLQPINSMRPLNSLQPRYLQPIPLRPMNSPQPRYVQPSHLQPINSLQPRYLQPIPLQPQNSQQPMNSQQPRYLQPIPLQPSLLQPMNSLQPSPLQPINSQQLISLEPNFLQPNPQQPSSLQSLLCLTDDGDSAERLPAVIRSACSSGSDLHSGNNIVQSNLRQSNLLQSDESSGDDSCGSSNSEFTTPRRSNNSTSPRSSSNSTSPRSNTISPRFSNDSTSSSSGTINSNGRTRILLTNESVSYTTNNNSNRNETCTESDWSDDPHTSLLRR